MNAADKVQVRVLRALCAQGSTWKAGQTIIATPLEADQIVAGGRARLVDPRDMAIVAHAVRRQFNRAVRRSRPPPSRLL